MCPSPGQRPPISLRKVYHFKLQLLQCRFEVTLLNFTQFRFSSSTKSFNKTICPLDFTQTPLLLKLVFLFHKIFQRFYIWTQPTLGQRLKYTMLCICSNLVLSFTEKCVESFVPSYVMHVFMFNEMHFFSYFFILDNN